MASASKILIFSAFYLIFAILNAILSIGPSIYIIAIIYNLIFCFIVYYDAKARNLNENYWLLIFFLGGIGGLIYYLVASKTKQI